MTKSQAEEILKTPKFGNPNCIEAIEHLKREERADGLRKQLLGKSIVCGPCSGTADNCKVCGPDGTVVLTKEQLRLMDVSAVESCAEELGITVKIEMISGKRLIAVLEEDASLDLEVWQEIIDRCKTGKTNRVRLVYPLRRFCEVRGFFADIFKITRQPCEGFSHDSPGRSFGPEERLKILTSEDGKPQ